MLSNYWHFYLFFDAVEMHQTTVIHIRDAATKFYSVFFKNLFLLLQQILLLFIFSASKITESFEGSFFSDF